MKIRGFVLGVALLAVVGWCMVQESIKQTRARYDMAELARREDEVKNRIAKLRAVEEELRSPARLAAMVREQRLNLVALGTTEPLPAPPRDGRWPGMILGEVRAAKPADADSGEDAVWNMASIEQR